MNVSIQALDDIAAPAPSGRRRLGPVGALLRWWTNHDLLFLAYVVFVGALFFGRPSQLATFIQLACMLTLALLPSLSVALLRFDHAIKVTIRITERLYRHFDVFASIVFCAVLVYLAALTMPGFFQLEVRWGSAVSHVKMAIEIVIFLGLTSFLVVNYPNFIRRLFVVLGIAAAFSVVLNAPDYVCPFDISTKGIDFCRFAPTFGLEQVPTIAGLAYALMFVGALGVAAAPSQAWHLRVPSLVAAMVLLAALLSTQARGGYAGAFIGAIIVTVATMRRQHLAIAIGIMAGAALSLLAFPLTREVILARGYSYRLELWGKYLRMALERPLLGHGELANTQVVLSDGTEIVHAHNLVLSAQVLGGIFGSGALLVIIGAGLYWAYRYARRMDNSIPLAVAATMAAGGVADFSLTTSRPDWLWVNFWLPIALCVGAEIAARQKIAAAQSAASVRLET